MKKSATQAGEKTGDAVPETPAKLTKRDNLMQAVKFTLFSISAGAIQVVTFTLLNEINKRAGWLSEDRSYWPFYLFALTLSVLWNFTFNRKFTFKAANNIPIAMLKVLGYYAVFTPLSTLWGNALTGIHWNEYVVLIGTMLINFVTEFLFDRFVVFGKSINTNDLAKKELEETPEKQPDSAE